MSNDCTERKDNKNAEKTGKVGYGHPPVGVRFSKDRQPGKNGRKPSLLKKYIVDNGISIQDVRLVMKNVIMEKTAEQLKDMLMDKNESMLVRSLIGAYLKDFSAGKIDSLNSVLDRIFGKALQEVALSGEVVTLTPEERRARIKELEEKRKHERETSEEG